MEVATIEGPAANGTAEVEMPGEAAEEQPAPAIEVEGDGQLSLKVGGEQPQKATVKLRGGSIGIPNGAYNKGQEVEYLIKLRCAEVHFVDRYDKATGAILDTERRHIMKVMGLERVR